MKLDDYRIGRSQSFIKNFPAPSSVGLILKPDRLGRRTANPSKQDVQKLHSRTSEKRYMVLCQSTSGGNTTDRTQSPNPPQISPETRSGSTPDRSGRRQATSRKYRRVQSECAYAPKSKGFGIYCTHGAVPKPRDRGVKRGKTSRRAWSC